MTAQTIGHYRITAKLGEAGMGEVWRATDPKLNRDVAIKILPEAFAQDNDRMTRFSREAQVLASLNHPNIAAVYGVEERALVLELADHPMLGAGVGFDPAVGSRKTGIVFPRCSGGLGPQLRVLRFYLPASQGLPQARVEWPRVQAHPGLVCSPEPRAASGEHSHPKLWTLSLGYRYQQSFRHFVGTVEQKQREMNRNQIYNLYHLIDFRPRAPINSSVECHGRHTAHLQSSEPAVRAERQAGAERYW
jgi:hypothetical protein